MPQYHVIKLGQAVEFHQITDLRDGSNCSIRVDGANGPLALVIGEQEDAARVGLPVITVYSENGQFDLTERHFQTFYGSTLYMHLYEYDASDRGAPGKLVGFGVLILALPTANTPPTHPLYVPPPVIIRPVAIDGLPRVGQTLTAIRALFSGADSAALQWLRNGAAIPGATTETYLLGNADRGSLISLRDTGTSEGGPTPSTSDYLGPVEAAAIEPPPVTLSALTLTASSVSEGVAAGATVGAVQGRTAGSALSLVDDAGGRFAISGGNIVRGVAALDHETAASHDITIRETLVGAANTPRDTTLTISVINVAETTLAELSLSASSVPENAPAGATVGSIQGRATGSTLTLADDAGGRFALSAGNMIVTGLTGLDHETADSHDITVRETHPDASNSPRETVLAITVLDSVTASLTASNSTLSAYEADPETVDVIAGATYTGSGTITISAANATLGAVSIETDSDGSVTGTSGRQYLLYTAADYDTGAADTISYTLTDGTLSASAEVAVEVKAFSVAYSGGSPTLEIDDENGTVRVEVTGNAHHNESVVIILADLDTGPVAAYAPVIYAADGGAVEDGNTISAQVAFWAGDAEDDPLDIVRQWYSGEEVIEGADGTSIAVDQSAHGGTVLTLVETATNAAGTRTATSNPITVPAVPSGAWTPANEATTSGWWDASDSASLTESGGKVSAVASQLSGGVGLTAADAAHEMILVASSPDFQNKQILVPKADWKASAMGEFEPRGYIADSAIAAQAVFCVTSFQAGQANIATYYNVLMSTHGVDTDRLMLDGREKDYWFSNNGRFDTNSRRKNGVAVPGTDGTVLPMDSSILSFVRSSPASLRLVFNYYHLNDEKPWSGPFAEVVVLDALPDAALIERYEGYLAHKWGLAGALPAGHTYKSAAPEL